MCIIVGYSANKNTNKSFKNRICGKNYILNFIHLKFIPHSIECPIIFLK